MTANKKVLDLGCGPHKLPGAVGIDLQQLPGVDVVHNLDIFPYPFEANSFDEVHCYHVLEHDGSSEELLLNKRA